MLAAMLIAFVLKVQENRLVFAVTALKIINLFSKLSEELGQVGKYDPG